MAQPSAAEAKLVDKNNNPQIGDQQVAITAITDNTGGTPTTLIDNTGPGTRDDIASINAKLIEVLDVIRYHGLIAGGTQVTAAESKIVDLGNIPMLGNRQAAITDLTNSTGSTVEDTIDWAAGGSSFIDDVATLGRDINLVLDVLEYHLLITGSGTQVTAAASKMTDKNNNPQIGEQQPAIVDLTDSTGGVISDIVDFPQFGYQDDFSALALKINEILELLRLHGLIED